MISLVARLQRWGLFTDPTESRYGLTRTLQAFVVLYMLVVTVVFATSLPPGSLAHGQEFLDRVASILLVDTLCLHLVLAMSRERYSTGEAVLSAAILAVAYLTQQSPLLGNVTYYLALTVGSCLLANRTAMSFPLFLGLMLGSNLVATLGISWMTAGVFDADALALRGLAWQFFIVNLVSFPYLSLFINSLTSLLRKREGDLAAIHQASRNLQISQQRLLISEKLASLGLLSGSIAHEMNNNLGAVFNSLELIDAQVGRTRQLMAHRALTDVECKQLLDAVERWAGLGRQASAQATTFIRSLKSQTRHLGASVQQEFSVAKVLTDVTQLMQHECAKHGCRLTVTSIMPEVTLYGDPGRFSQVMMNLIKNAVEAYPDMPERRDSPVWVSAREEDAYVMVEVMDNGCGIPPEHLSRVFDYLFTTKPVGQGTGLGLAIVHEIVTGDFGGHIDVQSREGRGTTFTLTFPRQELEIDRELAII